MLVGLARLRTLALVLFALVATAPAVAAQPVREELTIYVNEVTTWTPGYAMGDIVLRRVGGVLRGAASGDDVPARFGGDEFALLLTPASRERAEEIAEHVRAGIAGLAFDAEPDLACTVSVGLADSDGVYATLADWIRAADAALYRAKAAGRNRVEAA